MDRRCARPAPTAGLTQDSERDLHTGLPTGPSHAPDTASLLVGAAPGARVPPVDNPPRHRRP